MYAFINVLALFFYTILPVSEQISLTFAMMMLMCQQGTAICLFDLNKESINERNMHGYRTEGTHE